MTCIANYITKCYTKSMKRLISGRPMEWDEHKIKLTEKNMALVFKQQHMYLKMKTV